MKLYGGIILDYLSVPQFQIIPTWTSETIGNIIYCISEDDFFLSSQTGWIQLSNILNFLTQYGSTGGTGSTGMIGNCGSTGFSGYNGSKGGTGTSGSTGGTGRTGTTGGRGITGNTGGTGCKGYTGGTGPPGFNTLTGGTGGIGYTGGTGRKSEHTGIKGEHDYGTILGFIETQIKINNSIDIEIKNIYNGFDIEFTTLSYEINPSTYVYVTSDDKKIIINSFIPFPRFFKYAVSNIVYNDSSKDLKIYSHVIDKSIVFELFDLLTEKFISFKDLLDNSILIIQTHFITSFGKIPIYNLKIIIMCDIENENSSKNIVISNPKGIFCPSQCEKKYDKSTEINLVSIAHPDYTFLKWSDNVNSNENYCKFKIREDTIVYSYFSIKKFKLILKIIGDGKLQAVDDYTLYDCFTECEYLYSIHTNVKIFATPSTGYMLKSWSGYTELIQTDVECLAIMDSVIIIDAIFDKLIYILKIKIVSQGYGLVTGENINCLLECEYEYQSGDLIKLTAVPIDKYSFVNWSGDIESILKVIEFNITSNIEVIATFKEKPVLSVSIIPADSGDVKSMNNVWIDCPDSNCSYSYDYNEIVELEAFPKEFSSFVNWSDGIESTLSKISITILDDIHLVANFEILPMITVDRIPTVGYISSIPIGITCPDICQYWFQWDSTTQLIAIEDESCEFLKWEGEFSLIADKPDNEIEIICDKNKTLIAYFELLPYIQIIINPEGAGNVWSYDPADFIECPTKCISYKTKLYPPQSTVFKLKCDQNSGYTFDRWEGNGIVDPLNKYLYSISVLDEIEIVNVYYKSNELTLVIAPDKKGSATIKNDEFICDSTCIKVYPIGTTLEIEASLAGTDTYIFETWEGVFNSQDFNKVTLILNSPTTITAKYSKNTLTVNVIEPDSGSVVGNGINCSTICSKDYPYDTHIILTAIEIIGYIFDYWDGDCTPDLVDKRICTFNMTSSRIIKAYFKRYPILTVEINGGVGGSILSDGINCPTALCKQFYDFDEVINVKAVPDFGYTFVVWGGDITSIDKDINITMDSDRFLVAFFSSIPILNVFIDPTDDYGTITGSNINCPDVKCSEDYNVSDIVILTATPNTSIADELYEFINWTSSIDLRVASMDANPLFFNITNNVNLVAHFKKTPRLIVIINNPTFGLVTSSDTKINCGSTCSSIYNYGDSVTLTASVSNPIYLFVNWSGSVTSIDASITFTIQNGMTIYANFKEKVKYLLTIIVDSETYGKVTTPEITCPSSCTYLYYEDDIVTLTAIEINDGTFYQWSANVESPVASPTTGTIKMDSAKIVQAYFYKIIDGCGITISNLANHFGHYKIIKDDYSSFTVFYNFAGITNSIYIYSGITLAFGGATLLASKINVTGAGSINIKSINRVTDFITIYITVVTIAYSYNITCTPLGNFLVSVISKKIINGTVYDFPSADIYSTPVGIDINPPTLTDNGSFLENSTIQILASSTDYNYVFDNWWDYTTGIDTIQNPLSLFVDDNYTITAYFKFATKYTLKIYSCNYPDYGFVKYSSPHITTFSTQSSKIEIQVFENDTVTIEVSTSYTFLAFSSNVTKTGNKIGTIKILSDQIVYIYICKLLESFDFKRSSIGFYPNNDLRSIRDVRYFNIPIDECNGGFKIEFDYISYAFSVDIYDGIYDFLDSKVKLGSKSVSSDTYIQITNTNRTSDIITVAVYLSVNSQGYDYHFIWNNAIQVTLNFTDLTIENIPNYVSTKVYYEPSLIYGNYTSCKTIYSDDNNLVVKNIDYRRSTLGSSSTHVYKFGDIIRFRMHSDFVSESGFVFYKYKWYQNGQWNYHLTTSFDFTCPNVSQLSIFAIFGYTVCFQNIFRFPWIPSPNICSMIFYVPDYITTITITHNDSKTIKRALFFYDGIKTPTLNATLISDYSTGYISTDDIHVTLNTSDFPSNFITFYLSAESGKFLSESYFKLTYT